MSKFQGKGGGKGQTKTVAAGWKNKSKDGKTYISVKINGDRLVQDATGDITLFGYVNGFKEKDSDPDYVFYEPSENKGAAKPAPKRSAKVEAAEDDGELPF